MIFEHIRKGLPIALLASLFLWGCDNSSKHTESNPSEIISYSRSYPIKALDPATAGDITSSLAIGRICEGLVQYDYLAREPYEVVPQLAESMPDISDDHLVYTFKIRKGIYFHDDPCFPGGKGREVTAEDFIYSIKRVADVKVASSGFWAYNNRIVGINDFHEASKGDEPTDYDQEIEGLQALDSHTLQFKLSEPYPQFLYILTMHYAFAIPREAVEYYGEKIAEHPVGTGPYELVEWRRNNRIEFVRSPKWAETRRIDLFPDNAGPEQVVAGLAEDAGNSIPFVDRIVEFIVEDDTTAWMMFLSGQFSFSRISPDNWDAVVTPDKGLSDSLTKRGIEMISAPELMVRYIGFNWDDVVVGENSDPEQNLRNRKLRQALSCAYDFDQMNTFLNNRMQSINGPIPTPLTGCLKESSPYRFNIEKAKKLLAEAGYPGGIDPETGRKLKLSMDVGSADSTTRQMMELLTDIYQKIGIDLNVQYNTWPGFMEKLNRRQSQMFYLGWVTDYPDAENIFQLFYSKNESPGPNHANYRNPDIDALYEKIRTMHDSPERTALYEKMARMLVEDAPWIYCFQETSFILKQSWVKNYVFHNFPYGMDKFRRIDTEVRREWFESYGDEKMNMSGQE